MIPSSCVNCAFKVLGQTGQMLVDCVRVHVKNMGVSINGGIPIAGWFIRENGWFISKMDDLGVPPF